MSCSNCSCDACRDDDDVEELDDSECHACEMHLVEGLCPNEDCEYFECDPFAGGGTYLDEQKWERQQMGITS
jgi:hypothetical protein